MTHIMITIPNMCLGQRRLKHLKGELGSKKVLYLLHKSSEAYKNKRTGRYVTLIKMAAKALVAVVFFLLYNHKIGKSVPL